MKKIIYIIIFLLISNLSFGASGGNSSENNFYNEGKKLVLKS